MGGDLRHETWEHLARLTGENITAPHLVTVLNGILKKDRLSDLTEAEATGILEALSPLPKLRHLIWEAVQTAIESEQETARLHHTRSMVNIDAVAAADIIGPEILNRITDLLLSDHQQQIQLQSEPVIHTDLPG